MRGIRGGDCGRKTCVARPVVREWDEKVYMSTKKSIYMCVRTFEMPWQFDSWHDLLVSAAWETSK